MARSRAWSRPLGSTVRSGVQLSALIPADFRSWIVLSTLLLELEPPTLEFPKAVPCPALARLMAFWASTVAFFWLALTLKMLHLQLSGTNSQGRKFHPR